jgi:hypothetical protein
MEGESVQLYTYYYSKQSRLQQTPKTYRIKAPSKPTSLGPVVHF